MQTKIFAIGASGLIGSRLIELLNDKYVLENLSLETGVDITRPETLKTIREDQEHPILIHLAAKADVDGCEADKPLRENGGAYRINVIGTKNVVDVCRVSGKKIIYISTDFIFDGESPPPGGYTEESLPHPINWYGETKYKGEEVVKNSSIPYLIIRLSYPFRASVFAAKKDFVQGIIDRLKENQQINAVTDHVMTPTFVDDIAACIDVLIHHNATGIYHVVGGQSLSPYEAALHIAEKFGYNTSLINKMTRAEFFKNRAPRPFDLTLNNDKIQKLGVTMKTFEEGLSLLL